MNEARTVSNKTGKALQNPGAPKSFETVPPWVDVRTKIMR